MIQLGRKLKEYRLEAGLTQDVVAKALGYDSPQYVSNWERGMCAPNPENLPILADLYKVSLRSLTNEFLESVTTRIILRITKAKHAYRNTSKKRVA